MKLKNVADIISGITFRSRIEVTPKGNIQVIQMKDLGDDNYVDVQNCLSINYPAPKFNQLAMIGDIIFRSRGQTNTAALLSEKIDNMVVAAPLFRIRPNKEKVIPEYLLWWINQPASQIFLNSRSKGSVVKMISKQGLEDLEVILPSLEQQKKIVEFYNLSKQEQRILDTIKQHKIMQTQGILMHMASESNPMVYQKISNELKEQ